MTDLLSFSEEECILEKMLTGWLLFVSAFIQMSGQTVNYIDFFRWFMELIDNISQQSFAGGEHAVSDISDKFTVGLKEAFGNLIGKR